MTTPGSISPPQPASLLKALAARRNSCRRAHSTIGTLVGKTIVFLFEMWTHRSCFDSAPSGRRSARTGIRQNQAVPFALSPSTVLRTGYAKRRRRAKKGVSYPFFKNDPYSFPCTSSLSSLKFHLTLAQRHGYARPPTPASISLVRSVSHWQIVILNEPGW